MQWRVRKPNVTQNLGMTTRTDAVFDTTCRVSVAERGDDPVEGRVLVGQGQVAVATNGGGETVPVERVFDVSTAAVDADTHRVTVGYESPAERRTLRVLAGEETASRLQQAVFAAVIDGAWTTVQRRTTTGDRAGGTGGRTRRGRLVVGDGHLRIVADDEPVLVLQDVERVGQADAAERLRVAVRRPETTETYELGLPSPRLRNVVARYLRTACGADGTVPNRELRVLFVDDDVGFAELASEFLAHGDDDITVETVTDPAAGLDRLEQSPPIDCVVSDYRMPPTDGISFLRDVRERDPDVPFLLFTGRGDEAVAAEAIQAGVTDYIRKKGTAAQFAFLADRITRAVGADSNADLVDDGIAG